MSEKLNQIEKDRRRISRLYVDYCNRHYGGNWSDVVLTKKKVVRVDITERSISLCLIRFIETLSCAEFGELEGKERIVNLYQNMLNKEGSKLTPTAVEVMTETMQAAVKSAIDDPANSILQVVSND